jgi:5-methylcytosine-specific restriction enzyme A
VALRPCSGSPTCHHLVTSGLCAEHRRAREHRQGSSHSRGYTARWNRFRAWWMAELIRRDIVPACGARLPGAPETTHSRCQAEGRLVTERLHLDHIEPHNGDERRMFDPLGVQLLCARDHARKTVLEDGGFGRMAQGEGKKLAHARQTTAALSSTSVDFQRVGDGTRRHE